MTQSSPETGGTPPPPLYNMPPRSFGMPLWVKLFLGCGLLFFVLLLVLATGIARFRAARSSSLQTTWCVENLRTMHQGLALYLADYDDSYPQAASWMDAATPYVKKKTDFKCPIIRATHPEGFGYAFNSKLSGAKASKVAVPATTEEVYDSSRLERNASDALTSLPSPPRHTILRTRQAPNASPHGNVRLYADGHIAYVGVDGTAVDVSGMRQRRALFAPSIKTK